jgi:hypothetical protein
MEISKRNHINEMERGNNIDLIDIKIKRSQDKIISFLKVNK